MEEFRMSFESILNEEPALLAFIRYLSTNRSLTSSGFQSFQYKPGKAIFSGSEQLSFIIMGMH